MKKNNVSNFNIITYRNYYNTTVRIAAHITVWLLFIFFMYSGYLYNVNIPSVPAFFLSIRIFACTSMTFYFFFYFTFPFVSKTKKYYLYPIIVPFIFITWLSINKIGYSIAVYLGINLNPIYQYLGKNPSPSLSELFSFKYIFLNIPSVVFAISPFFFAKIVSELTNNYIQIIDSEKEKTKLKIEKIEMEKQFLLAQLNPHFLFNTLNNIYGLILKNDLRAGKTVISLAKIMKYTLYENNLEKVPLEREISFIEEYFNLNKARYSSNTDLQIKIDVNQDINALYIAPLITFVFIENSFKYGLKNKNNKFLNIYIKIENNNLFFSIKNDYDQILNKYSNRSSGLGLKNVNQRLNLIYANNHVLEITDKSQVFKVFLSIKLI